MAWKTAITGGPAAGVRWDLTHLYAGPDDPRIEKDLDGALAAAAAFAERYRGRVAALSAGELARAVDELEALQEPAARAGAFASLAFAADTATPRHGALLQHVQERGTEIRNTLLFFELEWLAADDAQRARRSSTIPRSRAAATSSALCAATAQHVLSEPEERVLAEAHNTGSAAWSRLFDQIMADLTFEVRIGGEARRLSEEETLALLYDPDRETRRRAAAAGLSAGLRANARVLGFIFNTLVQDKASDDRRRSYPHPMAARHLANEARRESVDALLDACVARYDLVARYYRLKARLLGLPDARRLRPLCAARRRRGPAQLRRGAPDRARAPTATSRRAWPSSPSASSTSAGSTPSCGPASAAAPSPPPRVPSVHPYVLLNYTGNLRDVMTVAHELGHGVHQSLASRAGPLRAGHAAHHRRDGERVRRDAHVPAPDARGDATRASAWRCCAESSRTHSPPCSARW